ncbi:hypothetical protein PM02_07065 [Sulfitobacter mediterraneus]|uniref:Uncharacterized protein n=1 Tax=Sulfitobacter mediterraneus TaxID=83219 RepID=A0A061SW42_9RHOB|nr:hypothetical protein PM02_07065 [Sulfitobacter mediterraneus]
MAKPRHHRADVGGDVLPRQSGAIREDDRQAQLPCGGQFGLRPAPARVLGNDMGDLVILEQRKVLRHVKRATGDDDSGIGQGQIMVRRIHKPQQVMMLRLGRKKTDMLFSNRQKHPRRCVGQGSNSIFQRRDKGPVVPGLRLPCRSFQPDQWRAGFSAGRICIAAHPRRKRMCGVNDMCDSLTAQIGCQSCHTAKAADPCRQGLRHRGIGAPGIGKHAVYSGLGQGLGHLAGFTGATQQKDAHDG